MSLPKGIFMKKINIVLTISIGSPIINERSPRVD